jgi:geranylgeranyl pyrophosphate synthase
MDHLIRIYADTVRQLILSESMLSEWADCSRLLLNSLSGTPASILALPVISCLAVGGSSENGAQVAAGWLAMNHALHLLDDVEDGDFVPDGDVDKPEKLLNLSTASMYIAYHFFTRLQPSERIGRVVRIFSECGFMATQGQHMGFEPLPNSLDEAINAYWQAIILKSGSLFRMACAGGAAAGTDVPDLIEALGDYGTSTGVVLQVLDDCRDMLDEKSGKREISLPVLLYSTALGGQEIVFPDSRNSLQETGITETITATLAAWWQRAQESLNCIESSEAKDLLNETLQSIVGLPASGEMQ